MFIKSRHICRFKSNEGKFIFYTTLYIRIIDSKKTLSYVFNFGLNSIQEPHEIDLTSLVVATPAILHRLDC